MKYTYGPWLIKVFSGFFCGMSFSDLRTAILDGFPLPLIILCLFSTLLNGYFAFRPLRGAEDDSGKGCQSERCQG